MKKTVLIPVVAALIGLHRSFAVESSSPPTSGKSQMVIQIPLPDSLKKADSALAEQRRFNEILFHMKSLEDADKLPGISPRDKIRLKEAFSARNPEIVLRKAVEKKGKAKK